MKKTTYPNRIVLRAPLWQRLFFPSLIPLVAYVVATDTTLKTPGGYTTGAFIALAVLLLLEIFFLMRFVLDGTMIVDPEGVSFTKLGKKHYYRWDEIENIYCMNAGGFFVYINGLRLNTKKIIMFIEYYGFFGGEGLGNFLKAYHKAALAAQGNTKQK